MLSAPKETVPITRPPSPHRGIARLPAFAVLLVTLLGSVLPSFAQTFVRSLTGVTEPTMLLVDTSTSTTWLYVAEHGDVPASGAVLGSPAPGNGGRVLRYNLTTGSPTPQVVANRGTGAGQFISPDGMVMNAAGFLFVADRYLDKVEELSIDATTGAGTRINGFGSSTTGAADEMHGPLGLARDSAGDIYVSEHGDGNPGANGNMVSKYSFVGGAWTRQWRVAGAGFSTPYGIAVSGAELYVSDGFNGRIQTLNTATGASVRNWSVPSGIIPLGLSLDGSNLWVGEASGNTGGTQQVVRANAVTGVVDLTLGTAGTGNMQFALPFHAVRNAATNKLYVSDYNNNRVQEIDLTAGPVDTTPPTVAVTGGSGAASPATFSVTFSETVTGVAPGVFTATASGGATVSGAIGVTGSGASYTVTVPFTGTAGSIALSLNATATTSVKDTSNNPYAGGATAGGSNTATFTVTGSSGDTTPPTVASISLAGANSTSGSYTVTFSEAVTGVTADDFAAFGTGGTSATVTGVTGSGTTWTVAFDYFGASGSLQMAIKTSATGIADLAGNAFVGGGVTASAPVANNTGPADMTPPTLTSLVGGTPTTSAVNFTATFSEAVTASDVTAADFTVIGTGTAAGSVGTVTGSGATYTVPVTFTGSGTLALRLVGGATTAIRDTTGNVMGTALTSAAVSVSGGAGSAPVISGAATGSATVGAAFSYQITASGSPTSYALASGTLPAGVTLNTSTGVVSATSVTGAAGSYPVTFTATNGTGTSAPFSYTLTVSAAGAAPVISGAATGSATVGSAFNYQITASGSPTSYALASGTLPAGVTLNASTGVVSATSVTGAAGSYPVTFTATNGTGTSAPFSFTLTVSAAGAAPVISSAATGSATVGTAFNYQITASGSPTSYALASGSLPTGVTLNGASGLVSGTPATGTAGSYPVTFTATNTTGTSAPFSFTLTVSGGVDTTAPTVASIVAQAQSAPGTGSYVVTFSEAVTGVDKTDFTAVVTGNVVVTLGTVTGSGSTYTVPFTFTGTSGTIQLKINATGTGIADLAANAFAGGGSTTGNTITVVPDTTAPTVSSFTIASSNSTSVTYQIVFSEAVMGVNAADFTAVRAPTGSGTATVGTVTAVSGTTYTIPVSYTGTGGSVQLNLNASGTGITDLSGNALVGGATGPVRTVTIAPAITSPLTATVVANSAFNYTITAANGALSYNATNLPAGLTFSSSIISGAVATPGTYNITISASNTAGSDTETLVLTVTSDGSTPPSSSGGGSGGGGGGGGGGGFVAIPPVLVFAPPSDLTVNSQITLSASTNSGQPVTFSVASGNATINNNVLTVTGPGAIVVRASVSAAGIYQAASTSATINVKSTQAITFNSPTSNIVIGQPITLSASSSAGLPITFSVVSGNASISGNVLTPKGPGAIVVRASQAGSDTIAAASTDVNFGSPSKAAQSINLAALSDTSATAGPITLSATSSAGMPVTFTVSGPAHLSGNSIILNGTPGTVSVTAAAAGNDSFNAAEVTRTFAVRSVGQQVYLGTMGSDSFGLIIASDNSKGVFVTRLAATGEAIVGKFKLNANGSFSANGTSSLTSSNDVSPDGTPATAAAAPVRTINGTVSNGVVSGSIAELNTNFTANVQPQVGSTASLAGLYTASIPGSASGDTYIVAGPTGQAYAVAVTPAGVTSGTGTISSDGAINITTSGNGSIVGTVNGTTGIMNGTLDTAGKTAALVGTSEVASESDRLVNLSSRLRVVSGDASRSVIAGFVVSGTESKQVLVRAVGPGLSSFGVTDGLAAPKLQLYNSAGALVAENTGWNNDANVAAIGDQVGAFKLNAGSRDSAVVATLAPGGYTAVVTGATGNGVALIEVYDAMSSAPIAAQHLVNLSTRGYVDTGDGQLIAGFVVTGSAPKRVLIRGIGPGLTQFGVTGAVADPALKVYAAGSNAVVAQNDNWSTPQPVDASQFAATATDVTAASSATGAFPLPAGSKDAAVVVTLMPGAYTAVVSGASNATGAGLVEVYEISNQ